MTDITTRLLEELDRQYMESLRHRYPDVVDIDEVHRLEMMRFAAGKLTLKERILILFRRQLPFERYFKAREFISGFGTADIARWESSLSLEDIHKILRGNGEIS